MDKALNCIFCDREPKVEPKNPEIQGDAWGLVQCETEGCLSPFIRTSSMELAITLWNSRILTTKARIRNGT